MDNFITDSVIESISDTSETRIKPAKPAKKSRAVKAAKQPKKNKRAKQSEPEDLEGLEPPEQTKKHKLRDPWKYVDILEDLGYSFRMNDLNDTVEVNDKIITDALEATIRTNMRKAGYEDVNVIKDAYIAHASANRYHPVRDYLGNLKWDGQDHIRKLASYFPDKHDLIVYEDGEDRTVFHAFLRRWMIGAVAKALRQEQNAMLVLAGRQGNGKSSFARWLTSGIGEDLSHEGPIQPDKDQAMSMLMTTKWVWEVGELGATTRRADVESLKFILTQKIANYRPPYGHNLLKKPILSSFIGTVNSDGNGFLVDMTGNRRFMVVELTDLNRAYSKDVDVNQVWAQAMHLYESGESPVLVDCEVMQRDANNAEHTISNPVEDWIRMFFDIDPARSDWCTETVSIVCALQSQGYKATERNCQMDIARFLHAQGCQKQQRPTRWTGVRRKTGT